jgi:hypothetical protein
MRYELTDHEWTAIKTRTQLRIWISSLRTRLANVWG